MEENRRKPDRIYYFKTACVITGGILVHLCLGSFYIFGNISPYMISYLRNRTDEHTLRNEDGLWILNAASIVSPFAMTLGGLLDRFLGVRIATGIGSTVFCLGVVLTYFAIKKSLVLVALSYGLLANFGSLCAYGPPAKTSVLWLPKRPTFAVGIIVCGYGGGALIFNQGLIVNRMDLDDTVRMHRLIWIQAGRKRKKHVFLQRALSIVTRYFTNKAVLDRIPKVFLLLAGIYACLQFFGVLLIFPHPSSKNVLSKLSIKEADVTPDDRDTPDEEQPLINGVNREEEEKQGLAAAKGREPIKTVLFRLLTNKNAYLWWFILFLVYGAMTIFNSLYKTYGQTFISDDHFLALVGSISSIFNSICRPIWGIMMDKFGFQIAVKVATTCFVCLSCSIMYTESLGKVAYLIWICGLYGASSSVWAIGPATLAKLFGADHMAINMGFLFIAVGAAAITGGFLGIGLQGVLGWHGLFLLAGFMGATAFVITFFFDGKDTDGRPI